MAAQQSSRSIPLMVAQGLTVAPLRCAPIALPGEKIIATYWAAPLTVSVGTLTSLLIVN